MEFHSQTAAQALWVRLLPDGRVQRRDGGAYPAPASWRITRCWHHGHGEMCLLKATIERKTFFANVEAARLAPIEITDGVTVCLERFTGR